jgi:hypothetical protein
MPQYNPASGPCADLRNAIHSLAPTAVLIRIYPEGRAVTHIFAADFYRALIGRETRMMVAHMVRHKFGNAPDWRRAHDFNLPTGGLYLTPEPYQKGYIPEDDMTFGLAPARLISIGDGNDR